MRKSLWPQSKKLAPLFSLLFLTMLFAACGGAGSIGAQSAPTPIPTPVPRTPQKLLADSQSAMNNLSSEHLMMAMSVKAQGGNTGSVSMNMTYEGDAKKPQHQLSLKNTVDLQIATMEQKQNLAEIVDGDKLYVQNKLGKWFVIENGATSATSAVDNDKFYQLAMQGKMTDKGHVTMDGVQVRHITVVIDNTTSNSLSSLFGSASNLANGAGIKNVTLDFWIDENTNYMHKMTMSFMMTISSSGTTVPMDASVQMSMSNFNHPVTITIPANAIPATSLSQVEQS
jgi:hypothetical protein